METNDFLLSLIRSGVSIIPIRDGDKNPAIHEWLPYKAEIATEEIALSWLQKYHSWGLVCGEVSGGVTCLDFDEKVKTGLYEKWKESLSEEAKTVLGTLPISTTRNHGYHVVFRSDTVEGNQKLARIKNEETVDTLVETRGRGGYSLIPPSNGYQTIQGSLVNIPKTSNETYQEFLHCARLLNEYFPEISVREKPTTNAVIASHERPSEFFERNTSWAEILEPHGCRIDFERDGVTHWTRPRKGHGTSLTTGYRAGEIGKDLCYVFTTNFHPLESERAYSKFAVYAYLNFGGDFTATAREITKTMSNEPRDKGLAENPKRAKKNGQAITICAADVVQEEIEWLWPDRFAIGKVSLIAGDPGLGKSFLTADMSARVSIGKTWPDGTPSQVGNVLFLSAEDSASDTIVPRLSAMGANLSNIHILEAIKEDTDGESHERSFSLESDIKTLEEKLEEIKNVRLLIIDPITAYLGGGKNFDSHRTSDVRAVLSPLAKLAEKKRIAVVAVTHLNKSGDQKALYRTTGSGAFVAAARIVYYVAPSKEDENLRIFTPVKANIARQMEALSFTIQHPQNEKAFLQWEKTSLGIIDIDKLLEKDKTHKEDGKLEEASNILRELFREKQEWERKEILKISKGSGISERTLDRARSELGIKSELSGFGTEKKSIWRGSSSPPTQQRTLPSAQNLGGFENVGGIGQNKGFLGV